MTTAEKLSPITRGKYLIKGFWEQIKNDKEFQAKMDKGTLAEFQDLAENEFQSVKQPLSVQLENARKQGIALLEENIDLNDKKARAEWAARYAPIQELISKLEKQIKAQKERAKAKTKEASGASGQ